MALTLQNSNISSVFSLRNKTKNYNNAIIANNNKSLSQIQIPYIPPEIINIILFHLKEDKKSLAACSLVNHTFNLHVTRFLYCTVNFTFPFTFQLFAKATNEISNRTCQIRHLDLSGFSTIGLQKSNATYKNIINPQSIINILRFCPNLVAFSVSESLESTITFELLGVLFYECKNLKMLDFCGCSSKQFATNFTKLAASLGKIDITSRINSDDDDDQQVQRYYQFEKIPNNNNNNNNNKSLLLNRIERISFHECPSLSEYSAIIPILAHMPNITHLDLGGCAISDATLEFLTYETNATTSLTDLSLAKCKNISSPAISSFISQCQELVTLNLYTDKAVLASITEYDLITMITSSPSSQKLQSLNIGSTNITPRVLYAIQESSSNLKHLGIAKANIASISQLTEFLNSMSSLEYVDFTSISCLSLLNTNNGFISSLRKDHPLHTIEMCHNLLKKLRAADGWKINENYSRRWYYAKDTPNNVRPDRVHSKKLDITQSGYEKMSKIFQYYAYGV